MLVYVSFERLDKGMSLQAENNGESRNKTFMKRFSKAVRTGHGARSKEDPVITDRLKAEDFVFTKVCKIDMGSCTNWAMLVWPN